MLGSGTTLAFQPLASMYAASSSVIPTRAFALESKMESNGRAGMEKSLCRNGLFQSSIPPAPANSRSWQNRTCGDGYLWYRGRSVAKELIKPGGESVYPAEVEAALKAHPAAAEAIAFGVPDKEWGEAIKAVCVLRAAAIATPDEISASVANRIARYKRPKHLVLAQELPRLDDGRIDRVRTRALFS